MAVKQMCVCVLQWAEIRPPKIALSPDAIRALPNTWFLGSTPIEYMVLEPYESATQMHLDRFSHFSTAHSTVVINQQTGTDTQTTLHR